MQTEISKMPSRGLSDLRLQSSGTRTWAGKRMGERQGWVCAESDLVYQRPVNLLREKKTSARYLSKFNTPQKTNHGLFGGEPGIELDRSGNTCKFPSKRCGTLPFRD
jgi:hypothetical protein